MAGMLQLLNMPGERAVCMPMIAKLLFAVESHSWRRM
jgi:hypothetical protein